MILSYLFSFVVCFPRLSLTEYSYQADIWSFGLCVAQAVCGGQGYFLILRNVLPNFTMSTWASPILRPCEIFQPRQFIKESEVSLLTAKEPFCHSARSNTQLAALPCLDFSSVFSFSFQWPRTNHDPLPVGFDHFFSHSSAQGGFFKWWGSLRNALGGTSCSGSTGQLRIGGKPLPLSRLHIRNKNKHVYCYILRICQ